jgi:hypothetical protein
MDTPQNVNPSVVILSTDTPEQAKVKIEAFFKEFIEPLQKAGPPTVDDYVLKIGAYDHFLT